MKTQAIKCPACGSAEMSSYGSEMYHSLEVHFAYGLDEPVAAELIHRAGLSANRSTSIFFECRACEAQHALHFVQGEDKTVMLWTAGDILA